MKKLLFFHKSNLLKSSGGSIATRYKFIKREKRFIFQGFISKNMVLETLNEWIFLDSGIFQVLTVHKAFFLKCPWLCLSKLQLNCTQRKILKERRKTKKYLEKDQRQSTIVNLRLIKPCQELTRARQNS